MRERGFLDRPVASLCLLGALSALSVFILLKGDYFDPGEGDERGYAVILRHYGQDAGEMERTAAIPLEDALALIPGIKGIFSSCEYGQVRVFAEFYKRAGYEAVREAAQRVYETLPRSAQRPEIYSSGNSRIPLWTAVAAGGEGLGTLLEKIVKPALEGLPGAGEVILSGTGIREIRVNFRNEEGALRGINAVDAAAALAENDGIFPGGVLREGGREIPLVLEGRYGDKESLGGAFTGGEGGRGLRLRDIGTLSTGDRKGDAISRLNGKTGAAISVMAASGANPAALSRQIRRELEKMEGLPLEFYVLEDRGKEEAEAFRSVLIASLEASLLVVLGMFFLLKRLKHPGSAILICAFSIPLISLFSAALLVCCRVPLDRKLLAGLSAGIGAAVDSVILCAELGDEASFRKLCPPLISGGATTIAALIPLHFLAAGHGLGPVILALGAVTLVSLIAALTVLRPLFLWDPCPFDFRFPRFGAAGVPPRKPRRAVPRAKPRRRSARFLAALAAAGLRHYRLFFAGALVFTLLGAGAVFLAGAGVDGTESPDTLSLRVEFEGGFRAAEGDRLLLDWAEELRTHRGIGDIQTSARSGSGSVLVTFDPKKIGSGAVRTLARSIPIPGAFVYIPESSGEERIWELVISGEDDEKCRELAREAAGICRSLPFVRQTVLNFKDGGPRLTLRPDREKLYARSLSFYEAAGTVRRGVYGPVAYKRIEAEGEIDVRIRGGEDLSLEDTLGLLVSGVTDRVDSLMVSEKGREPSSIQRRDRRRIASISFGTKPMDPRRIRDKLKEPLGKLKLPPGYTVEFDREAVEKAESLSGILWRFLGALLFCYMVIASAHESFILPLPILSVVPPSLAAPALLLAGSGRPLNTAAACAFVAVSGMAVNASVLTAGAFAPFLKGGGDLTAIRVYRAFKNLLPSLLATGGTTVLGALPFLFLREGSNELVRTLSLVTSLGVGSSCLISLLLIPPGIKIIGRIKNRTGPPA